MPTAQRGTLLAPWSRRVLLLFYLLFTLSPIVWLFLSTIQTQASLLRVPPQILPASITLRNYRDIFKPAAFGEHRGESTFLLALRNSIWISLVQPGGNNIPIRGPFSASHEIRAPLSNW